MAGGLMALRERDVPLTREGGRTPAVVVGSEKQNLGETRKEKKNSLTFLSFFFFFAFSLCHQLHFYERGTDRVEVCVPRR
jgi:hypothetical protein